MGWRSVPAQREYEPHLPPRDRHPYDSAAELLGVSFGNTKQTHSSHSNVPHGFGVGSPLGSLLLWWAPFG
eukprot:3936439-Rhodomonas_salina.3